MPHHQYYLCELCPPGQSACVSPHCQHLLFTKLVRNGEKRGRGKLHQCFAQSLHVMKLQPELSWVNTLQCGHFLSTPDFTSSSNFSSAIPFSRFFLINTSMKKCPDPSCTSIISDDDIELILPPEKFKKYEVFRLEKTLQLEQEFHRCLTPDCTNGVMVIPSPPPPTPNSEFTFPHVLI